MDKLGMDDSIPIDHPLISKSIENAQKKVESRNFDIRKHVLQYDDVLNHQREVIYSERLKALKGENVHETILAMIEKAVEETVGMFAGGSDYPEEWDLKGLLTYSEQLFLKKDDYQAEDLARLGKEEVVEQLKERALNNYYAREEELGAELLQDVERFVLLKVVDQKWMDHLDQMDQLRQGIGLRAYGQQDPLVAYRKEGHGMFEQMIDSIQEDVVRHIYRVSVAKQPRGGQKDLVENRGQGESQKQPVRVNKIGRNDPCPCGSGKKYKKCCGK